jgi:glutamate-ammonia-ligase adenylyltransferase
VDLRLRPDPRATQVAISMEAAANYYESMGQNWERAAMIKARPVAADRAAGEAFLREIRPFVWRRHLDFAAVADIHSIKRQIDLHKAERGAGGEIAVAGHDVKLGRGGIREIEFTVQVLQLIWGGRDPALRDPPLGTVALAAAADRPARRGRPRGCLRVLATWSTGCGWWRTARPRMPEDAGVARIASFFGPNPRPSAPPSPHLGRRAPPTACSRRSQRWPPKTPGARVFTGVEVTGPIRRCARWAM